MLDSFPVETNCYVNCVHEALRQNWNSKQIMHQLRKIIALQLFPITELIIEIMESILTVERN